MTVFDNESKINRIGGKLKSDYYDLRELVLYYNGNIIPLFYYLGIAKEEYKDRILRVLKYGRKGALSLFVEICTKEIAEGKIKLENVISSSSLAKEYSTQEKKESQINRAIKVNLTNTYKKVEEKWKKDYNTSICSYYVSHCDRLYFCRETLKLTQSGIAIDVDKFIEFYLSYLEADGSKTKKQHQEAADSINKFFNGAVEITQDELDKYFVIENGEVKPNPDSINRESYARLGARTIKRKR